MIIITVTIRERLSVHCNLIFVTNLVTELGSETMGHLTKLTTGSKFASTL